MAWVCGFCGAQAGHKRTVCRVQFEREVAEVASLKAQNEAMREALEGLLRDMHTGTSVSNRGSFHHDGLGCGRPCETCNKARAALSDAGKGYRLGGVRISPELGNWLLAKHVHDLWVGKYEGWLPPEVKEQARLAIGHAFHLIEHNKAMCVRCREAKQRLQAALDALEVK